MNPLWNPKSELEKKDKTGDLEQVRLLQAAYLSVTAPDKKLMDAKEELKALSAGIVASLASFDAIDLENYDERAEFAKAKKLSGIVDLKKMVTAVGQQLGTRFNQFVINLILFNFRTTAGGRARKSTVRLHKGADPHYARPFAGGLPFAVTLLLEAIKQPRPKTQTAGATGAVLTSQKGLKYLPPTRFTASFPLLLAGEKDGRQTLTAPELPSAANTNVAPLSVPSHIKYADLGSFGFAEPGYCSWQKNEATETAGTRLSLGAYALNPDYLDDLLGLIGKLSPTDKKNYAKYGSVGENHVKALRTLFSESKGTALAFKWLFQLVDASMALCTEADKHTPALRSFFLLIRQKIDVRTMKLQDIQKTGIGKQHNLFDYLWVFESTLWEFLFLGATCLPMKKIVDTLKAHPRLKPSLATWQPSVGQSEWPLVDPIKIGVHDFKRVYFPSGTAAAEELYEALWANAVGPFAMGTDLGKLSTFTPYFEFYQGHGILNPKEITEKASSREGRTKNCSATQIWLNLSDSLHDQFLNKPELTAVGDEIAKQVLAHVTLLLQNKPAPITNLTLNFSKIHLVIDFTKFASDIPNGHLYPLLAQLRETVLKSGTALGMTEVYFLRSNLKYNTGSLDRYQSGEVLLLDNLANKALTTSLSQRAGGLFKEPWLLMGEYIPMMKKVYLLSDAIGFARWEAYSQLSQSQSAQSLVDLRPRMFAFESELVALRDLLKRLIDNPLESILTNLIADMRTNAYKALLTAETRKATSDLWTQLSEDRVHLAKLDSKAKSLGELSRKVHEVVSYLEPTLQKLIDALTQAKQRLPTTWAKDKKQLFHAYLARLQAAKKLFDEAKPQATLAAMKPKPTT